MKYKVGDLLLVKHCEYKPRPQYSPRLRPLFHPRQHPRLELFNSYGIITQAIKHSDAWKGLSTSVDNTYIWFSQIHGKEYCFCEDEVIGEVVE